MKAKERREQQIQAYVNKSMPIKGTRAICLGKIKSKYVAIDILAYAAEQDAIKEANMLLWKCSKSHREFLSTNRGWYPKELKWKNYA